MRALITGITGFVGSHLAEFLLDRVEGVEVHGLKRWRSPLDNILGVLDRVHLWDGDLRDLKSMVRVVGEVRPDVVFHLAAQSYVPTSFDAPVDTIETNVCGTINLLEAIRLNELDPVIHICSSSEVYGQVRPEEVPIRETNPFRPASPYAVSKVGEDMVAWQYWTSWRLRTIRSRMFTHTGPRRGETFVVSAFAKQIAEIELGMREPVMRVGNLDSVRTFLDVRDAVRAYWLLTQKCEPGEVYNIGGRRTMKVGEMLDLLLGFSTVRGIDVRVDPQLLRPSDVTLQIPDTSKFEAATGWQPEIPFEQTLRDILDYWRGELRARREKLAQEQAQEQQQ